jgi:hypothetical protein
MKALDAVVDRQQIFRELKEKLQSDESSQYLKRTFSLFPEGFPVGRLVEISGAGKTEFLVQCLREAASDKIIWIEKELTINPFGLWQRGLHLSNVTFVETLDFNWAIQQILQSQIFQVIVLSQLHLTEKQLRRFQLQVEKSSSLLFLLSEEVHQSWALSLHLHVSDRKSLEVEVLRRRGSS